MLRRLPPWSGGSKVPGGPGIPRCRTRWHRSRSRHGHTQISLGSIVVAVDGSGHAARAVQWAVDQAGPSVARWWSSTPPARATFAALSGRNSPAPIRTAPPTSCTPRGRSWTTRWTSLGECSRNSRSCRCLSWATPGRSWSTSSPRAHLIVMASRRATETCRACCSARSAHRSAGTPSVRLFVCRPVSASPFDPRRRCGG